MRHFFTAGCGRQKTNKANGRKCASLPCRQVSLHSPADPANLGQTDRVCRPAAGVVRGTCFVWMDFCDVFANREGVRVGPRDV